MRIAENMVNLENIKTQKKKLLSIILIFTALLGICLLLINLIFYSNARPVFVPIGFTLLSIVAFIFNKKGFFKTAVLMIFTASLSAISINMIMGIGIIDPGIIALPAFTILGSILLGKKNIIVITIISITIITVIGILEITNVNHVPYPTNLRTILIYNFILVLSSILIYFIIRDNELYIESIKENAEIIKNQKEKLENTLEEKNILLQEIHHRIKNNMQILSSLLKLQSYKINSREDKKIFEDCYARINTMSLIHEKLSISDSLRKVNFKYYFEELLHQYDDLITNKNIQINFNVQEIEINLNQAVPVAMIINELISNSIKYAFTDKNNGNILISLKSVPDNSIELIVKDNGTGFINKDISENSIGLILVDSFSSQLDAVMKTDFNNKAEYSFIFKRQN